MRATRKTALAYEPGTRINSNDLLYGNAKKETTVKFEDWWKDQNPDHYDEMSARAAWDAKAACIRPVLEYAANEISIALAHQSPHQQNISQGLKEALLDLRRNTE